MAPHQHEPLRPLTIAEQAALARIVKASRERADRVRRATALVALAEGASLAQAARRAGCRSERSVAKLVGRFQRRGLAALDVAAGRGRRPTYDAVARGRIVATARRAPERRADRTATRSPGTLRRA